jgi:hypothetical protein
VVGAAAPPPPPPPPPHLAPSKSCPAGQQRLGEVGAAAGCNMERPGLRQRRYLQVACDV